MRPLSVLLVSLSLVACQSAGNVGQPDSWLPAVNSRLLLKQELTIQPGSAHVTIQSGRVVSISDRRSYYPYCELEVNSVRETPQTVSPDEFIIRKAYVESRTVSADGFRKVTQWADVRIGARSIVIYRTVFKLGSDRQPDVRWMTCERWGDAALDTHLTLDEIRQALGSYFSLLPPASGGSGT